MDILARIDELERACHAVARGLGRPVSGNGASPKLDPALTRAASVKRAHGNRVMQHVDVVAGGYSTRRNAAG